MNSPIYLPGMSMMTAEQKEHAKHAQRTQQMVKMGYGFYQTFVGNGDPPQLALERSQEAVRLWMEYKDATWIDMPEITAEQIQQAQAYQPPPIPQEWFDKFAEAIKSATLQVQGVKKLTKKQIVSALSSVGGETKRKRSLRR